MGAAHLDGLNLAEQELYTAMVERMRQLRRRAGVPDGVTLADAVSLHMVSAEEVARARWGAFGPPTPPR